MGDDETMQPAEPRPARLGAGDFLLLPEDGRRHELLGGDHRVTPGPSTRHQRLVLRLSVALALHVEQHPGAGEVFVAPFDVVLGPFDVVEPDVLLVAADQREQLTEQHMRGAPALVVEVTSPGTKRVDEQVKYELFATSGVREYWLVDAEAGRVTVFRRGPDGTFPRVADLQAVEHALLTTPQLPGFALPLTLLFR